MATNSNSDQGKIDNNELDVVETNESAQDMMRRVGIDIAYTAFYAEKDLSLENLKYESVVGDKENNSANASDANSSTSTSSSGGATITYVDAKVSEHNMADIIENPAIAIQEGELDKDKKDQIEKKAEKSQEQQKEVEGEVK